jgi:hypothetical protein
VGEEDGAYVVGTSEGARVGEEDGAYVVGTSEGARVGEEDGAYVVGVVGNRVGNDVVGRKVLTSTG